MLKWLLVVLIILVAMAVVLGGIVVWKLGRPEPPRTTVPPASEMKSGPNVTVYVHQSAINDMLAAMFPFEGEGKLLKRPLSIPYSWKVEKPHVEITADGPVFSATARVHVLGKTHEIAAEANAEVRYDSTAQELYMDLHEVQAHTEMKVLGISLRKLNLAPSDLDVRLLRHLPLLTHFKVKKPLGVREDVRFAIVGHRIRYEKGRVVVDFIVDFKELSQWKEEADSSRGSEGK